MSKDVIPFSFDGAPVRTVMIDGDPWWFVAADVISILELKGDAGQHVRSLDEDECRKVSRPTPDFKSGVTKQEQNGDEVWVVNESGLYALIMRSKKPAARRFRKWVTSDVLPAIRKTGGYKVPAPAQEPGDDLRDDGAAKSPGVRFTEERQRLGYATRREFAAAVGWKLNRITNFEELNLLPKKLDDVLLLMGIGFDCQYWRTGIRALTQAERKILALYRDKIALPPAGEK